MSSQANARLGGVSFEVIVLALLCGQTALATTLVFFADSKHILAGSDGKIVLGARERPEVGPKIRYCEGAIVGVSGLLYERMYVGTQDGYDAWKVVEKALQATNSVRGAMDLAEAVCSNALYRILTHTNVVPSPRLRGGFALSIVIGAMEKGTATLHVSDFAVTNSVRGTLEIRVERKEKLLAGTSTTYVTVGLAGGGTDDGVSAAYREHGDVGAVVTLIRSMIEAHPEEDGYPIYLLRLDANGIQRLPSVYGR